MNEEKSKCRILAVDDNKEVLHLIESILKYGDYDVITAENGKDAIELARQTKPALIVLDIDLPDIDGGEVGKVISQDPATAGIAILFLTGIIKKSEETPGMKSGGRDVMAKPVTTEGLLKKVRAILEEKALHEKVSRLLKQ